MGALRAFMIAPALHDALDGERYAFCVCRLGIHIIATHRELTTHMYFLSHGNDVALLWKSLKNASLSLYC